MRRIGQPVKMWVDLRPDGDHPVRLKLGGTCYAMDPDEAVDLANRLADAIERLRKGEQR